MKQVERYETVIVGGGQAGLSVGYHLKQQGHSFVILDASERIGDSWRNRWDSLRLYSPAFRDGLPGMPFPAPRSAYPTKDEMGDYLEAYATRFELPVRSGDGRRGADEGERPLRRERRRPALRGRQRRRRHGRLPAGRTRPSSRASSIRASPSFTPTTTATCRSCRTGRCSSSARATRARTSPTRHRRHTTSSSPAPTPGRFRCRSRAGADGIGFRRARVRRHARPQRGHADGPQDAPARPARRRAAPPLPQEGPARGGSRARPRANGRRRARPSRARRRSRPRRAQRRLVHRFPARLQLDSRSRSRSARTAIRCSTVAPPRRHPASTSRGCRSCTRSRRCSSPVAGETPHGSHATS